MPQIAGIEVDYRIYNLHHDACTESADECSYPDRPFEEPSDKELYYNYLTSSDSIVLIANLPLSLGLHGLFSSRASEVHPHSQIAIDT